MATYTYTYTYSDGTKLKSTYTYTTSSTNDSFTATITKMTDAYTSKNTSDTISLPSGSDDFWVGTSKLTIPISAVTLKGDGTAKTRFSGSKSATFKKTHSASTFRSPYGTVLSIPAKTKYTVTYDANGGSNAPAAQTKWYGETLQLSGSRPTRTGYTFSGWSKTSTGSVAYAPGANYTSNAAIKLYAVWKVNTYSVKYNANGGENAPASQTKTYGTTLKLTTAKPTRSGFKFLNWNTNSSGTGTSYASGANYTANAEVTLYAVWQQTYFAPTITNLVATRSIYDTESATYIEDDDGSVAHIKFNWAVGTSEAGTVTPTACKVRISEQGASQYSETVVTITSGFIEAWITDHVLDIEKAYDIVIIFEITSWPNTQKQTYISPAHFIMDINADLTGIGFGRSAPDGQYGIFSALDANVDGVVNIFPRVDDDDGITLERVDDVDLSTMLKVKRVKNGQVNSAGFGIGTGGVNHGIYSDILGKWMIYGNASTVYVNNINMTRTATSTISSVISANTTNVTITSAAFTQWGKIAQLYVAFKNKAAITVTATGNITDIEIGTIVSGKRPAIASYGSSNGNNAGQAWYNITTGGVISLSALEGTGSSRTIAAGTTFIVHATYILP